MQQSLGNLGNPRAVKPLIAALGDQDSSVREAVAKALGDLGDASAVEPLIAALEDRFADVRSESACALGKIGDVRAVEPLIAKLPRVYAVEALGVLGDIRAVGPLVITLRYRYSEGRKAAAIALDKLRWKPRSYETETAYCIMDPENWTPKRPEIR